MYRLSLIISEIYNKYLPLAEKEGIILNLDFSDTTKEITDPDRIKRYLDDNLSSTLKRSDRGEVTIGVDKTSITITDSATTLSHTACALLSNRYIEVSSRVGFGTTVKIFLQPRELPAQPTAKKPALKVEGVGVAAALNNEGTNPTFKSEVKVATKQGQKNLQLGAKLKLKGKSTMKTSTKNKLKSAEASAKKLKGKADRKLSAAAKKADKEVKRIAKKAEKQAKRLSKDAKKSTKAASQKVSKTAKTVGKKIGKASKDVKKDAKKVTQKTKRKLKLS